MSKILDTEIPLVAGERYHIFNKGNKGHLIFYEQRNYAYFLKKFAESMSGYVQTYAYALLPNHFHFAIQVSSKAALIESATKDFKTIHKNFLSLFLPTVQLYDNYTPVSFGFLMNLSAKNYHQFFQRYDYINLQEKLLEWVVSERLRILMMSYAKAINKQEKSSGSLFQKKFRRKVIFEDIYWQHLILYLHRNPIHHGRALILEDWIWTSFQSLLSDKPTRLCRQQVFDLFGGQEKFLAAHRQHIIEWKKKEKWVLEE